MAADGPCQCAAGGATRGGLCGGREGLAPGCEGTPHRPKTSIQCAAARDHRQTSLSPGRSEPEAADTCALHHGPQVTRRGPGDSAPPQGCYGHASKYLIKKGI